MRLLTSCRNGGKTEKACIHQTNEAAAYFTETKSSGDGAGEVQPCGLRIIDHQSIHLHPFASPAKLPPDFPPHSSFPLTRPGRSTNFLFPFHGVRNEYGTIYAILSDFGDRMTTQHLD